MGKHYVPRFYLKGFTERNEPSFIWAYEKGRKKPFRSNIVNIAQENQIYSDETEKHLTYDVEMPANPIIQKIREHRNITKSDKVILSKYMSVLMRRIPRSREKATEWFDQSIGDYYQHIENDLNNLLAENPDKQEIISNRLNELNNIRNTDAITPKETWGKIILENEHSTISQVICDMTWQFLVFDKWPAFLTSDNPVFFFEGMGIGKKYSEISFPISENIVLWATWRADLEEKYVKTKEHIVREINHRTISFATRYIYFSSYEKWITKLANQHNIDLNRIL